MGGYSRHSTRSNLSGGTKGGGMDWIATNVDAIQLYCCGPVVLLVLFFILLSWGDR